MKETQQTEYRLPNERLVKRPLLLPKRNKKERNKTLLDFATNGGYIYKPLRGTTLQAEPGPLKVYNYLDNEGALNEEAREIRETT